MRVYKYLAARLQRQDVQHTQPEFSDLDRCPPERVQGLKKGSPSSFLFRVVQPGDPSSSVLAPL